MVIEQVLRFLFKQIDSTQLILLTHEVRSYFMNASLVPMKLWFYSWFIHNWWYLCKVAVTDGTLQSGASGTPDKTCSLSPIRRDFGHPA